MTEQIITIMVAVFASTGFWSFITSRFQRRDNVTDKKTAEGEMLRGLGHDRICYLGQMYIKKGHITKEDYENLHDYLFIPYKKLGGNGTAEKIMNDVEKLPIKED